MRKCNGRSFHAASFLAVGLVVVLAEHAAASDMGEAAAAIVSEESYRHFLDDMLYTHRGDNRGFGAEHDLAQANIVALFESFGLVVTLESVVYGSDTYYNVVGTKLGTTHPDQEYIIGAHYDSVNNPGADDNASGTALTLEAARVLGPFESDYTIRFVAFDREEQGLYGSWAYVAAHSGDDILGMISADMVAYNLGTFLVDVYCDDNSLGLRDDMTQAVALYGDGLGYRASGNSGGSDHVPFQSYGYQACLVIEDWGNPNYHTDWDNVDTPKYIDYAMATRVTRSIVGWLVDQAGVNVPIADGDFDGDGDVDFGDRLQFELCFTGPDGGPVDPDCEPGDLDYDGDIDCTDWDRFVLRWPLPGYPPDLADCPMTGPQSPRFPPTTRKHRYVSIDPTTNRTQTVAFDVTLSSMRRCSGDNSLTCSGDTDCPAGTEPCAEHPHVGTVLGWVGEPDAGGVARVVAAPVYREWTERTVHVGDCEIVPVATYGFRATPDEVLYSDPWEAGTIAKPGGLHYGDTVGMGTGDLPPLEGFTPPNRVVNVTDVQAFILTNQGASTPSAHYTWVDLHGTDDGSPPDQVLNVSDLQRILFGFAGQPYTQTPEQLDPADCP